MSMSSLSNYNPQFFQVMKTNDEYKLISVGLIAGHDKPYTCANCIAHLRTCKIQWLWVERNWI